MKPLKLSMTAFGPYAEKTEIDFRELDNGVYLITGDTGAGKTTIFDAIVFALYGEGSGSGRNSDMFHSDYVDKFTDTEVTLDFLCQGKEYRVTRIIHYKKKRGDGGVGGIAKNAVLHCPEELPIEKETAVNAKVTEILGLDEKQFRQIVMLAQGEFRKFLEAKSDAREQILGKLFDHRIFVDFQNRLKLAADLLRKERENKEKEISFYLSEEVTWEELSEKTKELQQQKSLIEKKMNEENDSIECLQKQLVAANQFNEKKRNLKNAENNYFKITEQLKEKKNLSIVLEKEKKDNEKKLPDIDELKIQIQNIQKCLEYYEKFEQSLLRKKKLQDALAECKKNQKAIESKNQTYRDEQNKILELLESLKNVEVETAKVEHELNECIRIGKQLQELRVRLKNHEKLHEKLAYKQEQWKQQQIIYEQAAEVYLEKNRLFLAGQAGVLAESLRKTIEESEHGICPVCKTVVDRSCISQFAVFEKEVPTQEDVEASREQMDRRQEQASACAKDCEVLKNTVEMSRLEALDFSGRLFEKEVEWETLEEGDFLERYIAVWNEQYKQKEKKLKNLADDVKEKKQLEKRQLELLKLLEISQKQMEENQNSIYDHEKKNAIIDTEIEHLKNSLIFQSKQEAMAHEKVLKEKKIKLEQQVYMTEQVLNKCREEISHLQGKESELCLQKQTIENEIKLMLTKETWLERYKDAEVPEEDIKRQIDERTAWKKGLEEQKEAIGYLLEKNRQSLVKVGELQKELSETKAGYEKLWKLSALANGQSGEGGKYSFSRYVLGTFFEEIIKQANEHLDRMTGGKYELIRQQEAERKNESAGLGMVIFDAYTGERRDTASLSGGESFQVSLSLALGLSDVVRSRSVGYTLDTMFIDEGFGSLDEQALDQAMEVLHELSGDTRQIGIISHVGKLAENISQKIYVKRSPRGSSVQIMK